MDELKKLIEALGRAFEEFKAANDLRIKAIETKGYAPADVVEKIEKINADMTKISDMKAQLEAIETAIAKSDMPGGGSSITSAQKAHMQAFEKWFRKGGDGPATAALLNDLAVKAELSTLSDPDGGFITAPPVIESTIDRVASTMSAMRRISTVMSITADAYKKFVNQGGNTHGWVGEKQARTETNTPTLTEIVINVKEIYSMPATTQTLLDDAIRDIGAWLADEVSIDFAESEGDGFINGNGVAQMKGLNSYTKIADASYAWGKIGFIASGHATLLNNADKLMDLELALKSVYLSGASWLMNRSTINVIRKFKDGEGNYIWRPGLEAGAPNTLLGYPIATDDNVDSVGAGKFPIYFGNFKRAYLVVDRQGIRVIRDNLTEKGKVLFYTTKRVGGGIVMYEAIKALKISA
jgi:HK97 family phage major capsid protein